MNPILQETIENPAYWLLVEPAGMGLLYCPVTRFVGCFSKVHKQWIIHGPHENFDAAVAWLRWSSPHIELHDETVEQWRERIESGTKVH